MKLSKSAQKVSLLGNTRLPLSSMVIMVYKSRGVVRFMGFSLSDVDYDVGIDGDPVPVTCLGCLVKDPLRIVMKIQRLTLTFDPWIRFLHGLPGTAKVDAVLLGIGGEDEPLQPLSSTDHFKSIEEVSDMVPFMSQFY